MKVLLSVRTDYYELNLNNNIVKFKLEQIENLSVCYKINYLSILCFFCFCIIKYIIIIFFFEVNDMLLLFLFFYLMLFYSEFIYKPIYIIQLNLFSKSIFFKTYDKYLFNDFLMIQFFLNNEFR